MDIDKMFKLPALPAAGGGNKRKMGVLPSEETLKRFRPNESESTNGNGSNGSSSEDKGKARAARVEEEEDDEMAYARPDLPDPDDDDEDGRFFGGGLNDEQEQILDIFDRAGDDGEASTALSLPALRRQLAKFERAAVKNAEQRGKYPDDPTKFIDSESDLDAALKHLLPLTQNPALYYPELVKSGAVARLANLLSHENTDIAIDVVDVVRELTDEDVGAEVDDLDRDREDEGVGSGARMAIGEFIDELLNSSLLDLLVSNLSRLKESESDTTEDTDAQGVYSILGVFENLLSFLPPIADTIARDTTLISWLLKRIQKKEYDSNKQYAAEVLAIMLQSPVVVDVVGRLEGVEVLLGVVSQYRKKDPGDGEEVEFMENAFNALCSLVGDDSGAGKAAFVEAEGVELMVIMMKEKLLARTRAIKLLDYAFQTELGTPACERFVEMLGLKPFFSAFMGKGEEKKKNPHATSPREDEEHLIGILSALFTNLPSDSAERIRVVAKFVENEYAKVERLLEIRETAMGRLRSVEAEIEVEKDVARQNGEEITEDDEDEWYTRRIDAGLAAVQNANYVLAWVMMEDDGAMAHAKTMLRRKGQSLSNVIEILDELRRNTGEDPEEDGAEEANRHVILGGLIEFLTGSL